MKKIILLCAIAGLFTACANKQEEAPAAPAENTPVEEVYLPQHQTKALEAKELRKYNYYNAPTAAAASKVVVTYDEKNSSAKPIEVAFSYPNGDSFVYTLPAGFSLWKNSAGKVRIVSDGEQTVWLQGQTKKGKFCEFVFFGDPKHNGAKIKPNSYTGKITYRK